MSGKRAVWRYKTKNFEIVCEAEQQSFIDPMVHGEALLDAIERGDAVVEHWQARIYWKGTEVGSASKCDCVSIGEPLDEFSPYQGMVDVIFRDHHEHRNHVVRLAIADARRQLADLDLPGLLLRKAS